MGIIHCIVDLFFSGLQKKTHMTPRVSKILSSLCELKHTLLFKTYFPSTQPNGHTDSPAHAPVLMLIGLCC